MLLLLLLLRRRRRRGVLLRGQDVGRLRVARVRAPVVGVGAVPVRGGGHLVGGGAARRGVGEVDACKNKKGKEKLYYYIIIYGKCTVGKEKSCIFSIRFGAFF